MKCNSSPRKEEQQVPTEDLQLEGNILGYELDENEAIYGSSVSWDYMDWTETFTAADGFIEEDDEDLRRTLIDDNIKKEISTESSSCVGFVIKNEDEEDDKRELGLNLNLNLNLNYEQVLDAWSDRGPLLATDIASSYGHYMGEVPVMEEERARREASVLRYKEKRQTRLFSKKIRYEVRKLNADKRPRLKGRFVKRDSRKDS